MSILQEISNNYRIDASKPASSNEDIQELMEVSEIELPKEYLNIIEELTEFEINVQKRKYIRIWGAKRCTEMNEAYYIQKYIPGSLAIGDNEEGSALIYAHGKEGFGLYLVEYDDLDVEELVFIARSLTDLLVHEIGIGVF
jgi:hypothetical protein